MSSGRFQALEDRLAAAMSGAEEVDALNALAGGLIEENIDRAEKLAQRALHISQNTDLPGFPYQKGKAFGLAKLGAIAKLRCDYRAALTHLLEAQILLENLGVLDELLLVLRDLGWVYFNVGDFPRAIEILHKALRLSRGSEDARFEARILTSLGAIYGENGDRQESIEALRRALQCLEGTDNIRQRCLIYNNLAMTQFELQAFDEALDSASQSFMLAQQLGSVDLMASVLDTTGQIFLAKQDFSRAEEFFKQALALHQGEGNDPDEIQLNLARAVMGQGRLDEVMNWLFQSLESLEARGVKRFTYQVYDLLSRIYEEKGDLVKAIEYHKLFHEVKSKLHNEETRQRLGNLMVSRQAETARIDAEINRLKNQTLLQEISDHRRVLVEMETSATTDALTGLLNRRHIMTLGGYAFESAHRAGQLLSALMMDIDDFKKVNDRYGHLAGDQVLMELGAIIQTSMRQEDLFGRIGGEEFAAVLPGAGVSAAQNVAQRILEHVARHSTWVGQQGIQITLSIGIALAEPADESLEGLLKRADRALYAAKRAGKNRVVVAWSKDS
jgi:diguanylate cyclase (GGDEF)-like protein